MLGGSTMTMSHGASFISSQCFASSTMHGHALERGSNPLRARLWRAASIAPAATSTLVTAVAPPAAAATENQPV